MRRYRVPLGPSVTFFAVRSWAGCITNMSGFDLRQAQVTAEQDAVVTRPSTVVETIEIDLAGKYCVRVSSGVDAEALRRVLDVLERRR